MSCSDTSITRMFSFVVICVCIIICALATFILRRSEINLGQLCREKFGKMCFNIGFTTYGGACASNSLFLFFNIFSLVSSSGTVTAASDWSGEAERKRVRPGMLGSYEALFHEVSCTTLVSYCGEILIRLNLILWYSLGLRTSRLT